MSVDKDKVLDEIKGYAKAELEKRAVEIRERFAAQFKEFMEVSKLDVLDDLMKRAAAYEVSAVTEEDSNKARQYAEAASDVLRQISLVLVTERVVASKQVANMIQAAALTVWDGFKSVGSLVLGVAVKAAVQGAVDGLTGGQGGAAAGAAADFLGGLGDGA